MLDGGNTQQNHDTDAFMNLFDTVLLRHLSTDRKKSLRRRLEMIWCAAAPIRACFPVVGEPAVWFQLAGSAGSRASASLAFSTLLCESVSPIR
jgi:hypothetical protein